MLIASLSPFVCVLVVNRLCFPGCFPFAGTVFWLLFVFLLRRCFSGAFRRGIRLVKKGEFAAAVPEFRKTYDDMSARPWIDRHRWLFLSSASEWTYRELALTNMAFCYGQMGEGTRMREYYERTLAEFPGNTLAVMSLKMLDAASPEPTDGTAR